MIKAKSVSRDGVALIAKARLSESSSRFVNALLSIDGVSNATLVSYNGDYLRQSVQSDEQREVPTTPNGEQPEGDFLGDTLDMELLMQAMEIVRVGGREITDDVRAALLELGLTEGQINLFSHMQGGIPGGNGGRGGFADSGGQRALPGDNGNGGGQVYMPSGNANAPSEATNPDRTTPAERHLEQDTPLQ